MKVPSPGALLLLSTSLCLPGQQTSPYFDKDPTAATRAATKPQAEPEGWHQHEPPPAYREPLTPYLHEYVIPIERWVGKRVLFRSDGRIGTIVSVKTRGATETKVVVRFQEAVGDNKKPKQYAFTTSTAADIEHQGSSSSRK